VIQKKICLLGSFAVGKTSLAERFVYSIFSDRYRTTVGVRIHRKGIKIEERLVNLIIWDLAGEDEFVVLRPAYLRGTSGYILVADGTRPDTLDKVINLRSRVRSELGDVPFLLVVNKIDRSDESTIPGAALQDLVKQGWPIVRASAKSGTGVTEAFSQIAGKVGYG
jgi:small GTP-binding protein